MPNWMDILSAGTQSVVPRRAIQSLQEMLAPGSSAEIQGGLGDVPGALGDIAGNFLDYPMETLGGFASGALEGARGEVNPLNLASLAIPALVGMKGAGRAGGMLDDAVRAMPEGGTPRPPYGRQQFDVVTPQPPRQVMPSMDDVDAIIADSRRMQARVPQATGQYRGPGAPTASARNMPPEFVPRGGETVYNAGRPSIGPSVNMPPPRPPVGAGGPPPLPMGTLADQVQQSADPVGDNLARIEEALRARFNQQPTQFNPRGMSYPGGYGRGPSNLPPR